MVHGIATQHTTQSRFGQPRSLRCCEIRNQIKMGLAVVASPAKLKTGRVHGRKFHRLLTVEGAHDAAAMDLETLALESNLKQIEIDHQCGQDGQMGHVTGMPAQSDPSQMDSGRYSALVVPAIGPWPRFDPPLQLGVMASGNGTNFEALHNAIVCGELDAQIRLLVVNKPECGASEKARQLGIRCEFRDHRLFASREALDQELVRTFSDASVEAVVMAGWMRIVTPVLIDAFPGRLINIHPSLLPSFKGMDAVGQCLRSGTTLSGCTVHEVLGDVDAGPILAQAAVPVLPGDDRERLARRIQKEEHRLLPWATALAGRRWRSATEIQG